MRLMHPALVGLFLLAGAASASAQAQSQGQSQAQVNQLFSGLRGDSTESIQVEADSLEVTEQPTQRVSVFKGNVTVQRSGTTLKAATITIYSPAGDANNNNKDAFERIEASGKVFVSDANQVATSDAARFDAKSQVAVLTGNVVLSQGNNVITGERLTVNLNNGQARIEQGAGGRIKGIFSPGAVQAPRPTQ